MNKNLLIGKWTSGVWGKAVMFSLILFFIGLGDAILSDWVPAFIQKSFSSPLLMGMIMSFSSVIGFGADIVFPQMFKGAESKKMLLLSIGASLIFTGLLIWSISWPALAIILGAMAVWGIYYEFLGFGSQQYVSNYVPVAARSGVWAIIGVFRSLAYFLGPIIGGMVALDQGNYAVVLWASGAIFISYIIFLFIGNKHKNLEQSDRFEKINLLDEIRKWIVLFEHVWPVLLMSILLGVIDAIYWTSGTVLSDNLAIGNKWGGMFLPFYMLPTVVVGLMVAKWGIYKGKKKIAEAFLLLSGLFLGFMGISSSLPFLLVMALLSGITLSVSWPLTEAVYSDITSRMGGEGKHMMGLSNSTISLAYIIGPLLAGATAQIVGERMTFSFAGMLVVLVAAGLLVVTPRKLRLPQAEIQTWD